MSRITVGQLEVNDGPNGIKKLQVHVQTRFQVDCDCDQISVKTYWHAESAGGTIISPSGTSSTGDTTDPQGVPWEWTPGQDGCGLLILLTLILNGIAGNANLVQMEILLQ